MDISESSFMNLKAAFGPYWGVTNYSSSISDATSWKAGSQTESSFGVYVGLEFTSLLTDHFTIGASAGYHYIGEFDDPVGGRTDFSSPEFKLSFGYMWGGN